MKEKLLELKDISKSFGQTKALSGVSFDLEAGEVHCLVGENGAGKSTLIKILAGIHQPDTGMVLIDGSEVKIQTPNDAEALGISVVHQELILCTELTVAENIFLGREPMKGKFIDRKKQRQMAEELLKGIDPSIDPDAIVASLPTGKKQVTEIARAASAGSRIVIFDEPTSSLSNEEAGKLMTIIENMKKEGLGIIYISHRMEEIFRLADKVTVLRDGMSVGSLEKDKIDRNTIVSMMVGRPLSNYYIRNYKPGNGKLFEAEHISGEMIRDASFYLREGEILGFYGLIGAGRTELMRLIFGIDKKTGGTIKIDGREMKMKSISDCIRNGLVYVPEDRKNEGLFLDKSIAYNATICSLEKIIRNLRVKSSVEKEIVDNCRSQMAIKMASADQEVQALSGGNQQKVLIGRWLQVAKKIIILDEPTRGIDVGAKTDIYKLLDDLTHQGFGVIIISSELQEIVGMCDRVYVMHEMKISGCLEKEEISQENIMNYAVGGR